MNLTDTNWLVHTHTQAQQHRTQILPHTFTMKKKTQTKSIDNWSFIHQFKCVGYYSQVFHFIWFDFDVKCKMRAWFQFLFAPTTWNGCTWRVEIQNHVKWNCHCHCNWNEYCFMFCLATWFVRVHNEEPANQIQRVWCLKYCKSFFPCCLLSSIH